jgi:RHS repeat-associated protein
MLPFMLSPRSLLLGLFFMSHNYITDHLGSTRVVLNNAGSVLERYDYYPYGEKIDVSVANTGNTDYLYTGKESQQSLFGINWYDSGARFQTTDGIFTGIDPLAEKYYHISPYAYCAGNPVNLMDLKGLNPIYSTKGDLLGTDDNGLQGEVWTILTYPELDH